MSGVIRWEEPPAAPTHHDRIAADLRSRPGQWALVMERVNRNNATKISNAVHAAYLPAGAFEATSVGRGDGTTDIFARYVGHEKPPGRRETPTINSSTEGLNSQPRRPGLLTLHDVADRLSISERMARTLMQNRLIKTVKIGRATRVTEEGLADYIRSQTRGARS